MYVVVVPGTSSIITRHSSRCTPYIVVCPVSCGAKAPALPTGGQIFQTFVTLERVANHDPSKVVRSIGRTTNRQQLNMYRATIHIGAISEYIIITIQYCNRNRTPMGEKSTAHPHAYIHQQECPVWNHQFLRHPPVMTQ